jgi:hypothetical protein
MAHHVTSQEGLTGIAIPSVVSPALCARFQISLDVSLNQSHECRDCGNYPKGRIKLMTMQQQDQPTAASEPSESGKARAAARKPPAATTKARSTRRPGRGKKAPKRRPKAKADTRQGSKSAHVIALLEKSKGATLAELMKATGWQAHSVRGFLSGTLRKKMGLKIESTKRGGLERVYSISR